MRPAIKGPILPDDEKPTVPPNDFCDFGWHFVMETSKCYLYSSDDKSWLSAQQYCTSFGATLASINSPDAQEKLFLFAKMDPSALGKTC